VKHSLTNDQLLKLWEQSSPLNRCWLTFAPKEKRAAWDLAHTPSAIEAYTTAAKDALADKTEGLNAFVAGTNAANQILQPRMQIESELKEQLLSYLQGGQVTALGFEQPRKLASHVVPVPKQLWHGWFRWDKETIERDGLNLVAIRVCPTHWIDTLANKAIPKTQAKPVGRPSLEAAIRSSITTLQNRGQINIDASIALHFDAIRAICYETDPHLYARHPSISDKTVRKYFSPIYKALLEGKKL